MHVTGGRFASTNGTITRHSTRGAGLIRSLIATRFIDEYHMPIPPVALGSGLPLFTSLARTPHLKVGGRKSIPGRSHYHTRAVYAFPAFQRRGFHAQTRK